MSTPSGSVYLCVKQFNARLGDELLLKIGDKVEVLADDSEYNDGWYMGRNLLTSEVGLYPKTFTQLLHTPKTTLLRLRLRRVALTTSLNKVTDGVASISVSLPNPNLDNNNAAADDTINTSNIDHNPYDDIPPTPPQKDKTYTEFRSGGGVSSTMSDIDRALEELKAERQLVLQSYYPKHEQMKQQLQQQNQFYHQPQHQYLLLQYETSRQLLPNHHNNPLQKPSHHQRGISINLFSDDLNPTEAASWTPKQVTQYFAVNLGFDLEVAGNFARHKISGEILFQMTLDFLKEIDIDLFGSRFQVQKEIEKLKKMSESKLQPKHSAKKSSSHLDSQDSVETPVANSTPTTSVSESVSHAHGELSGDSTANDVSTMTPEQQQQQQHTPRKNDFDSYSRASTMLMPSAPLEQAKPPTPSQFSHQRKHLQSLDNLSGFSTPMEDRRKSMAISTPLQLFMSPRKAPEPPAASSPLDKVHNGINNHNEKLPTGLGILERPTSLIYDNLISSRGHHRRNSLAVLNSAMGLHRRHSSLFLFLLTAEDLSIQDPAHLDTPKAPSKLSRQSGTPQSYKSKKEASTPAGKDSEVVDIDSTTLSPKKLKLVSQKLPKSMLLDDKRSISDNTPTVSRLKTLRSTSTQNFRNLTSLKKLKTLAFQEGIRQITPSEAIKAAAYSGWMLKKLLLNIGWRLRYFTLHGTRLSYFTSLKDKRERGLIDITAHKVLPVGSEENPNSNDKYVAMYALSTGYGLYCFKVVPPAPGFKKGLTFTQPKTHYFAVETQEEMRGWLKALMTATIDIDDTVPVVLSCQTPTVSLVRAQELLSKAREETKLRDEELRSQGYFRDGYDYQTELMALGMATPSQNGDLTNNLDDITEGNGKGSVSNLEDVFLSEENLPLVQNGASKPQLMLDTLARNPSVQSKTPTTPLILQNGGFASPYLLALGLLSPKLGHLSTSSVGTGSSPVVGGANGLQTKLDYYNNSGLNSVNGDGTPKLIFLSSAGRVVSGSSRKLEKMFAYSNDGSGNHSFVIKPKKN